MLDLINLMCATFKTNNVILFEDFNLPSINWINFVPVHSNVISEQFLDCVLSNSLNQIIKFPKRLNNILDLIFCKNFYLEPAVCLTLPLVNTDHELISLSIDLSYLSSIPNKSCTNKTSAIERYNFHKTEGLNNYFSCINWYFMFSYTKNIEEAWNVFKNTVVTAIAKFVPKSFICKRVKCVPKYIKRAINNKRYYWSLFKRTKSLHYKEKHLFFSFTLTLIIEYDYFKLTSFVEIKRANYFILM